MAHLSRKTVKLLADLYTTVFRATARSPTSYGWSLRKEQLYHLVYEEDCDPWLCAHIERFSWDRDLHKFILKLHTGDSVNNDTWTRDARQAFGQARLVELCGAIFRAGGNLLTDLQRTPLRSALELDGYAVRDGRLLPTEGEHQDVEAERGELAQLYIDLGLANGPIVEDCLNASETHYIEGRYRDCIANARHYEEQILHDVALAWSQRPGAPALVIGPTQPPAGPCRNYLHDVGLLSEAERDAFRTLHGLLSETGGHPNLSERDEARVFRRLATSMAFYVLLRYRALR